MALPICVTVRERLRCPSRTATLLFANSHVALRERQITLLCKTRKTHYKTALKICLNDLCFSRLFSRKCLIFTQISQCLRLARPRNLTDCASLRPRLSALPSVYAPDGKREYYDAFFMRFLGRAKRKHCEICVRITNRNSGNKMQNLYRFF